LRRSTDDARQPVNFIEDVLERFPASRPALLAISRHGERRTWHFGELIAMSAGLSGAFAARGVHRGDVVMTLVGNRVEWVLSLLACWRMGAVALPCNTQLRRADLAHRARVAVPALCVGEPDLLAELPGGIPCMTLDDVADALDEDRPQEPPAEVADLDPSDPALIVFTSGTTGEPRAALHAQRYLAAQRTQAEHWLGAREGDLVWCTTATGWSKSARNVFVAPWLCSAAALICDARFDPAERLELVESEGVSVLCQAPTEYRLVANRADLRPLPPLRRMVSAGEALNPEAIEAWRDHTGLDIHDGYGQTETGHLTGNLVGAQVRDGSMGRPLPGFELRVAGGELQVRVASCPTFFSRYLDSDPFEGEWWPTGDLVREDADGYLWYEGRHDDLIVSAGYRIGPSEVESALLAHPAVAEAVAIPAPDPERGSVVKAVVVTRDRPPSDDLAGELQAHVKRVTAPYKFPRIVEFADALPRTSSGKVRRAALRPGRPPGATDSGEPRPRH
jgi:acyl-coenzyme A synthetase/AMP-(fatty) acid ligase